MAPAQRCSWVRQRTRLSQCMQSSDRVYAAEGDPGRVAGRRAGPAEAESRGTDEQRGSPVDLHSHVTYLTLAISCRFIFGPRPVPHRKGPHGRSRASGWPGWLAGA